jgi:hypothetical protein
VLRIEFRGSLKAYPIHNRANCARCLGCGSCFEQLCTLFGQDILDTLTASVVRSGSRGAVPTPRLPTEYSRCPLSPKQLAMGLTGRGGRAPYPRTYTVGEVV